MLIDQENANVLPLGCESLKGLLDRCIVRLAVDNQEVLLRIGWLRNMLYEMYQLCFANSSEVRAIILQYQLIAAQ